MNRVDAAKEIDRTDHPFHDRNRMISIDRLIDEEDDYYEQRTTGKRGGVQDEPMWYEQILNDL